MGRKISFLVLCLVLGASSAFAEADKPAVVPAPELIFEEGFESGIGAWRTVGDAAFAVDTAAPHGGTQCAVIRVAPEAAPAYQHLERSIDAVAWGDTFHVTLWVRAEGISGGTCAYAALEFLDAAGNRAGIAHSRTDAAIGLHGWESLEIEGQATKSAVRASLHLLLHAHGVAWFDDVRVVRTSRRVPFPDPGDGERRITVHADREVLDHFGGVGFHYFAHTFPAPQEFLDTVLAKRWRELNPSFARMNHQNSWDRAMLDQAAAHMLRMKEETGTELYVTTWDPKDTQTEEERRAYAESVADVLDYWIRERGAANIRTYCMTNELSLNGWGSLRGDLPKFKLYHETLFQVFQERGLPVQLLATDASPFSYWDTLPWAAEHMDAVTGVYGGHHYISEYEPDDPYFYPWFRAKVGEGVQVARSKGKDFILGEFGSRQDGSVVDGIKRDTCIYWDTPLEPMVGIQLAEAVIAALDAGVYAMGYWTFADFPDDYNPHYINKWGLFKRSGTDYSTRAHYYAYGLLTRYFRGPAAILDVESDDPRVRAAAVRSKETGGLSIALVNRYDRALPVVVSLDAVDAPIIFRQYVYDPVRVPMNPFGDLQDPEGVVRAEAGELRVTVGANTLMVLTSAYDETPPEPVAELRAETADGVTRLSWRASPSADLCYYRVYHVSGTTGPLNTENQIGSTIATSFADAREGDALPGHYAVVPVDRCGNAGAPAFL